MLIAKANEFRRAILAGRKVKAKWLLVREAEKQIVASGTFSSDIPVSETVVTKLKAISKGTEIYQVNLDFLHHSVKNFDKDDELAIDMTPFQDGQCNIHVIAHPREKAHDVDVSTGKRDEYKVLDIGESPDIVEWLSPDVMPAIRRVIPFADTHEIDAVGFRLLYGGIIMDKENEKIVGMDGISMMVHDVDKVPCTVVFPVCDFLKKTLVKTKDDVAFSRDKGVICLETSDYQYFCLQREVEDPHYYQHAIPYVGDYYKKRSLCLSFDDRKTIQKHAFVNQFTEQVDFYMKDTKVFVVDVDGGQHELVNSSCSNLCDGIFVTVKMDIIEKVMKASIDTLLVTDRTSVIACVSEDKAVYFMPMRPVRHLTTC